MFAFTETITIRATPKAVWEVMTDLERWWVASNPEHESLERLDDSGTSVGARLFIRERVAGIPGEYTGVLTRVVPGSEVTMEAPAARYRLLGLRFTVSEGVTWRIEPVGQDGLSSDPAGDPAGTRVSARVWARFGRGLVGRGVEWVFTRLLDGVAQDREHARVELRYLKQVIEHPGGESAGTR